MTRIELLQGDITKVPLDALVNAANSSLLGGGGVDGAIHRAGGPAILEACRRIGYCAPGEAVLTTAGRLPAKKVIHTVGPVWRGGTQGEAGVLADCYRNSLRLATENGLKTVAFPNISTGVYGYHKRPAAEIAVGTVRAVLTEYPEIERVTFVCFDAENFEIYRALVP